MKRMPFRQILMLMLGLLVALGMSVSAIQASSMAAGAIMSGQMFAGGMGHCGSCKDDPGGAKAVACDAACAIPLNATNPQLVALLIEHPLDRPVFQAPVPS